MQGRKQFNISGSLSTWLTVALSVSIMAGAGLLFGAIFLLVYCCAGRQPPKCCK